MTRTAAPKMTVEDVSLWRSLIMERSGLFFTDSRLYFLAQRLWERIQLHRLASYAEYYRYLVLSRDGQQEWLLLLEELLNNETRFFRHQPSFRALRESVLPALWERKEGSDDGLTVWSVGCSAGQEVYSLAMLLLEWELFAPSRIKITGSDISCRKLEQARNGRYQSFEVDSLPSYYQDKYTMKHEQARHTFYEMTGSVRQLTHFDHLNLQTDVAYQPQQQDIIFCQNVLIYFNNKTRSTIAQRLSGSLSPGGFLFFAPTDVVGLRLPQLRPFYFPDTLVYQRAVA